MDTNQKQVASTDRLTFKQKMQSIFVENKFNNSNMAIFSLINRFFWKSKIAPLSMFGFPLIFMIIYFAISQSGNSSFVLSVLDGLNLYISFSTMPIALVCLPQLLVELKQSIILRRIAISNVSSFRYNTLMSIYFLSMCIISTLFIFVVSSIFEYTNVVEYFEYFNGGEYVFALLFFYLSCISLGIILSSISKTASWVQLTGLGILLVSLMLAGQFIPIQIISNLLPVKIISLFSPLDYSMSLMNNVLYANDSIRTIAKAFPNLHLNDSIIDYLSTNLGFSIFDFTHNFKIIASFPTSGVAFPNGMQTFTMLDPIVKSQLDVIISKASPIYDEWQKGLNAIVPFLFVVGSSYISIKKFKWSSR